MQMLKHMGLRRSTTLGHVLSATEVKEGIWAYQRGRKTGSRGPRL